MRERQGLVDRLQKLLRDLGLEGRTKDVDLATALATPHRQAPKKDADPPSAFV